MNWEQTKEFLVPCLPEELRAEMALMNPGELQEIRLRCNQPCVFRTAERTRALHWTPTQKDLETLSEALCGHSLYARQEEVRQGYVTLQGGHRMGLCGTVRMRGGVPQVLDGTGSVCLRIAAEWPGAAGLLKPFLPANNLPQSLLIIGGCGTGKTTLLRDAARMLGSGDTMLQAAVIDERGEIAACERGVPQLNVGVTTDVLEGCAKDIAVQWLLRSMNPQVIITDELCSAADVSAVADAMACGCAVVASVHGTSLNDLASRPVMASLMARRAFAHYAVLSPDGCGKIAAIYDKNGSPVRWPA